MKTRINLRLKDYDYSDAGMYFVTVCCNEHKTYFMQYPQLKNIVENEIDNISQKYDIMNIDQHVIMPNHVHMIVAIGSGHYNVETTLAVARSSEKRAGARPAPTLGMIVGSFKSICVTKWISCLKNINIDASGKFWHRNYYEHIIRNEKELDSIRKYIANNPIRWEFDIENPEAEPNETENTFWKSFSFDSNKNGY